MIRYSQQDPLWKNKQLGTGECTIGSDGCFLTCFAMLLEIEPDEVNDRIKTFGGFSGSLLSAWTIPNAYKQLYIDSQVFCQNNPAPLKTIDNALASGLAVIVQTDTKLDPGIQSHFVILTGKVGNDYSMVDPWPIVDEPPATLLGRYGHGRDAKTVITYILVIGGVSSVVEPVVASVPAPVSTDHVTVVSDYVSIRKEPNTNGSPIGKALYGMDFETAGDPLPRTGTVKGWQPVIVYIATGQDDDGDYLEVT
jgi:hypothetical protein